MAQVIIDQNNTRPRKRIAQHLKRAVWHKYAGKNIMTKCFCCNLETIPYLLFDCGRLTHQRNGEEPTIETLRPVCSLCKRSMKTSKKNMEEIMAQCGYTKNQHWNGYQGLGEDQDE